MTAQAKNTLAVVGVILSLGIVGLIIWLVTRKPKATGGPSPSGTPSGGSGGSGGSGSGNSFYMGQGSNGQAVKVLQQKMNGVLGKLAPSVLHSNGIMALLVTDGNWGAKTQTAFEFLSSQLPNGPGRLTAIHTQTEYNDIISRLTYYASIL